MKIASLGMGIAWLLLIGAVAVAAQETANSAAVSAKAESSVDTTLTVNAGSHKVIAYYFHGNARCETCLKLESMTQKAVEGKFGKAVKSGEVEFQVINVELPENEHFRDDFDLITRSVVIADTWNGKAVRYQNMERRYELLENKSAFMKYISGQIKKYLQNN